MNKIRRLLQRWSEDGGAAIIEFALVAPLLLTLVWGIIESGRAFYTINSLASAVRDSARYGAAACLLGPPPVTNFANDPNCELAMKNLVVTGFQPLGPLIDASKVITGVNGDQIKVEASYEYRPITPVAQVKFTITRAAAFRYERLP